MRDLLFLVVVVRTGADILVAGRTNWPRRVIHGSVSARLVRSAPCGVLVVH
jgi:nucleotide-binding universal stress UspA family protein